MFFFLNYLPQSSIVLGCLIKSQVAIEDYKRKKKLKFPYDQALKTQPLLKAPKSSTEGGLFTNRKVMLLFITSE